MQKNWTTRSGRWTFKSNNDIFLHKCHEREEKVSEHKFINIVVELIREKFVKPDSFCALLPIHPCIGFLSLVPQSRSDFGSHPFEGVIVLEKIPVESPYFVSSGNWVDTFRDTSFESLCVLYNDRIILWVVVGFLLLIALWLFFLTFGLSFSLLIDFLLLFIDLCLLLILAVFVDELPHVAINFWEFRSILFRQCAWTEPVQYFNWEFSTMVLSEFLEGEYWRSLWVGNLH